MKTKKIMKKMNKKQSPQDNEVINIPYTLRDSGNKVIINVVRKMFSNDAPQISIEFLNERGMMDACCYYSDLTNTEKEEVKDAIDNYDRYMVKKSL